MKKTLLSLMLAMAFGMTCSAAELVAPPKVKTLPVSTDSRLNLATSPEFKINFAENQASSVSRATETINYTPADSPYSYGAFKDVEKGDQVAFLMEFDKANTEFFAGNTITGFFTFSPANSQLSSMTGSTMNTIKNATVFMTEDLGEEPFYTQDVKFGSAGLTQTFFTLDTPYKVEAGKTFFIGIKFTVSSPFDYYFVYDGAYHDSDAGGYYGVCDKGSTDWYWGNISEQLGFFCQGVVITGDKLPHDYADIPATSAPMVLTKGQASYYIALVRNNAANEISTVEVTTTVGNQTPYTQTIALPSPIGYAATAQIQVTNLVCESTGANIPMTSKITKINGQPNNDTSEYTTLLTCMDSNTGYDRKVVLEEGTGTWCGWCPLGYTTMETIREKYSDIIPVAVHAGSNEEPMLSATYAQVASALFGSYPSAVMNRYATVNIQSLQSVEEYYNAFKAIPAIADVKLSFMPNDDWSAVQLTASATFAFDYVNNDTFQFAYVLTEDNVGPYTQQNNASGDKDFSGTVWYDQPKKVDLIFNDVARDIKDAFGLANSLPANISKGQVVTHSTTMSTANISDVKNMNMAVYLINTTTGMIENAAMIKAEQAAGVTNAVVENDNVTVTTVNGGITVEGDVENVDVYGIDGRHVAHSKAAGTINLAGGLYIVKANDTTVKVVVK